jgi:competence ComEA-like helix-hairpin-helix protein
MEMTKIVILLAVAGLAFAAEEDEAKGLPEGAGKDAVIKVCLSCHGPGNFRKLRLGKEGWTEQVADMVDRGAEATAAQSAAVVDYLTQNFGKDSKIYVNTAPFEELKAVFGLTVPEAQAMVARRKEKGDFKSWDELRATPGVDSAKFEKKKELIAF